MFHQTNSFLKMEKDLKYLHTPVQTIIDPPIDATIQELPLEKLSWEDFEKLCLAIVQTDFSINDCEIYGIKGQAQEGIDIFARQANGKYSSYQCKKYAKFEEGDLNKAVNHFKTKGFYKKSDYLYLCTSCELNKTQVQNRFEELKTELEKENITFVKWDKIQLTRILKDKPQIVFDFFGSEWVRKFNGEPSLLQISKAKKLDAKQVVEFRKELYDFYSTIFNIHDPGIPIKELKTPFSIQDRFIVPDILSNVKEESYQKEKRRSYSTVNLNEYYYYDNYSYNLSENELRRRNWIYYNDDIDESNYDIRIKIDDALVNSNRNIIIGDPGVGKSTLLRYITLDILSPNPQLENISQKYGKTLPVWLPFAFITKHLSQNDSLSISDILSLWFNGFEKKHLFEIAKKALEDERLFLVVDGIDEWSSISSAQQAITRIETIRELYDCKVLYSSRPYGFRMLKDFFTNLNELNLAGFSIEQQKDFIEKWYTKWTSLQDDIHDKDFSKTLTDNFIKELEQAGDLKKLAEIPLLLSILILQKMQDSVLPKNKLEALKEITHYLIKKHPTKRVTHAGIIQESTNDVDFKDVFCELAVFIQTESNDGVILKSEAQEMITQYLVKYVGYDIAKAKVRSKELLEIGANNFGIIIEKSQDEISFGHRQFQEFLAAQCLYDSDEDYVKEFINQYAANPTFHQVIVNLFGLIPIKQVKKYTTFFDELTKAVCAKYQEDYLKLISYEIAINLENTPTNILNSSFESIISDFEYETDPTYKEALLRRILNSLQNGRLEQKAQNYLTRYFPNQNKFRDYRINALKNSEHINDLQLEFLKKAFINGTIELRHDASHIFNRHIKNENVFNFVKDIILKCSNPDILSFAINSIITNELSEQDRETLIKTIEIDAPIVQLYLFKHKVFSKKHTEDDLKQILHILNQVPYQLEQEVVNLLVDGFEKNTFLKKTLIKSVEKKDYFQENSTVISSDIAWKVLFRSFNKDVDVIGLVKSEFENEEYPFTFAIQRELFQDLLHYINNIDELIPSIEKWLDRKLKKYNSVDPAVAFACALIHTDRTKDILLQDLPRSGTSHWNVMALLEGWADDDKIIEELKGYFRTVETRKTSLSAHFVPKIFKSDEKEEAIKILEDILFNKELIFRERAISPLIEIDKGYFENNVLNKLIDELGSFLKNIWGQYYDALNTIAKNFPQDKKVQEYILERIENDIILYGMSIQYFPELISNEEKLLKKSIPLSKELRLLIIEAFSELPILPDNIETVLSNFETEEEEEVMADMAVCLFNHIKENNQSKIIKLSKPLVFARGYDHEVKRNIAFTGFLISKKLDEYFEEEDVFDSQYKDKSRRLTVFNEYYYERYSSVMMIKSIIDNFDYLISFAGKDFRIIVENLNLDKNVENIWSFFARYSVKSSPTYNHIMEFIANNYTTINNSSLISFLNRTTPKNPFLKEILLRLIINSDINSNKILVGRLLGTNFKDDNQVYDEVKNVKDYDDVGRIIALCSGWPQEPILKEIFEEIVEHQIYVDNYVGFNLKFLFRDVNNLVEFMKNVFTNAGELKLYHKFFFVPMIERLKIDEAFSLAIKELLLSSKSVSEKISYYNLLSQVNMVDEEVISWKSKITDFKNDFGYDIVSNKTVRLKNILYDYYY